MSTDEQARALMIHHYHMIRNRQQSMLGRAAAEVGMDPIEASHFWSHIQGKPSSNSEKNYDRSHVGLS